MVYSFRNDYSEGAHPLLIEALARLGGEQNAGYGCDVHCRNAADLLRQRFGCSDAAVHFFEGGTQANMTALCAFLRPHEAAIAVAAGHIATHEAGAIEATGHKVCIADGIGGKLTPETIMAVCRAHTDEHMVKPKLAYISNATECGTSYCRGELQTLGRCCHDNGLILYLDGARLGSALCAEGNDLSPADLGAFSDAFYVGGTKNGALFGEALLICNPALETDFRYIYKQRGAMLAKGSAIGAQFEALFSGTLYFDLARHANTMAGILLSGLEAEGITFLSGSRTNQIFPILPDALVRELSGTYDFEEWLRVDGQHTAIRLVTSWATQENVVRRFLHDFTAMKIRLQG